jgi:hypothetical protein
MERWLKEGPSKPEDYQLRVSVIAFALAKVSMWEGKTQEDD